jgi:putative nucleotidyltransferase with HDIG domain
MIPTVPQCFRLMDEYRMLDNIRDHSIIVARLSRRLAGELIRAGHRLEVPLVVAAALLHDIGKTACLDCDRDHAAYGREICRSQGFEEVAEIVGGHVRYRGKEGLAVGEYEVVFYADKRVTHDQVVSLAQREDYILERYGRNDPARLAAIRANCRDWLRIETALFASLAIVPAELANLIDLDPSTCDCSGRQVPEAAA